MLRWGHRRQRPVAKAIHVWQKWRKADGAGDVFEAAGFRVKNAILIDGWIASLLTAEDICPSAVERDVGIACWQNLTLVKEIIWVERVINEARFIENSVAQFRPFADKDLCGVAKRSSRRVQIG